MDLEKTHNNLNRLADKIKQDIRQRCLKSGEPYMTSTQLAEQHGVSRATAHRAVRLLVAQDVLVARQGSGTYIGSSGVASDSRARMKSLIILQAGYQSNHVLGVIGYLSGHLHAFFKDYIIQSVSLPREGALAIAREVVGRSLEQGELGGVICISNGRDVYQYLIDAGVPTLVLGSLHSDQHSLPSIDADKKQMGSELFKYLFSRGHRKFILLQAAQGRAGAVIFQDRIVEELTEHGLPASALKVRLGFNDIEVIKNDLRDLLTSNEHPTGIIADSYVHALAAKDVIEDLGLRLGIDVDVVTTRALAQKIDDCLFPYVRPVKNFDEIARDVSIAMHKVMHNELFKILHVKEGVEFIVPESYRALHSEVKVG